MFTFFPFKMRLLNESGNSIGQLIYHDNSLDCTVDHFIIAAPRQRKTQFEMIESITEA